MLIYSIVVITILLLGLFVDESKMGLSIKLALLYGGLMMLIGWWLDWPAQLARDTAFVRPIWAFITARIMARLPVLSKADDRFRDIPLTTYFALNLIPFFFFLLG